MIWVVSKSHSRPRLRDPGIAYGIIPAFSVQATHPLDDRDALDQLFREYHLAWEKMGKAAQSLVTRNEQASNTAGPPLFRINGCWGSKGKQIVDRGFILFGHSNSLQDFMNRCDRPYILKTEPETETVSVFSDRGNNGGSVFVEDLGDPHEILGSSLDKKLSELTNNLNQQQIKKLNIDGVGKGIIQLAIEEIKTEDLAKVSVQELIRTLERILSTNTN